MKTSIPLPIATLGTFSIVFKLKYDGQTLLNTKVELPQKECEYFYITYMYTIDF